MVEGVVSVCWKDHRSELATVYKSLLENGFLVDCTLSAEGQSLKAHRLILSACSPYFHTLFREESGERPVIILLGASFEALKAVIDFVYRGETQISKENLQAFLALAQSLQIKGLKAFSKDYKNKNMSRGTAKDVQGPSARKQNSCEVQSVCASHKDNPENYSQQHLHNLKGYPDAVHTVCSVVAERGSGLCEEERSVSVVTPSIELEKPSESEEELMDSEITVKFEPLFPAFSLEPRKEVLDRVKCNEPTSGNSMSGMEGRIDSVCGEQDLNQFSSCSEPSHGNVELSVMPHSQQRLTQLSDEGSSVRDVAEGDGPLLPTILVPKQEHSDDEEWGETMDDFDVSGKDQNEPDERTEPANPDLSSKTQQNLTKRILNKSLRCPPLDPRDSDVGTSESEIVEHRRVSTRKKRKIRTDQTKVVEAEYINTLNGAALVNKLVTSPQASTQLNFHVNAHPSRLRTSKPSQKSYSSSVNSEPESCTHTSDLPTPLPHNPNSSLTAQSNKDHLLRKEARTSGYQSEGQSELPPSIGMQFLEELRSIRQDIKSLNDRVKSSEETLGAAGLVPESDQATQQPGGERVPAPREELHPLPSHGGRGADESRLSGEEAVHSEASTSPVASRSRQRQHCCAVCGATFPSPSALAIHRRRHTGERPYRCEFCDASFAKSSVLVSHRRKHTGERPFGCEVCGASFTKSSALVSHRRMHTGERPFPCDVCGVSFAQSTTLANHKRTHTGERPFACDVCGIAFTQQATLNQHARVHTGERAHCCETCGKAFVSKMDLVRHTRTHTGERPFRCELCGDAFAQVCTLANHTRTHTGERPYRCDVCGNAFSHANTLSVHRRTHTGERPFTCEVCGKAFTTKTNLGSHMRTHTGERPFRCDVCDKDFSSRSSFTNHKRTHANVPQ